MEIPMKEWMNYIRQVEPYTPGEQPQDKTVIKLNTNENPYPPSPKVQEALSSIHRFRFYPDPTASKLVNKLAETYHLNPNQIFVGVGSDDVLAMTFLTFFNSKKPILFPDITYSFYDVWAELFQVPYECPPLDEEFRIRKEDYYKENGGIIFPNPNAPTGVAEGLDFIEDILKYNQKSVVVIDEAYVDFGTKSALELIDRYDNLLVIQTFSKSRSMAGMRIGYAMGNPVLIKALNDVKYSFNSYTMNEAAIELGTAALEDKEYFEDMLNKIVATREKTKTALKEMGFQFADSKANFIFVTHPSISAQVLYEALKNEKIYVRYFNKPRIDNYLRITIGTDVEMETFINYLQKFTNL